MPTRDQAAQACSGAIAALENVMTRLDQARGRGDIELSRLVGAIDTDVQMARTALSTIAQAVEPIEADLRGHLKVAREHLCAAQPQCVIVASRYQLQQALDRIDYVAHHEGVEPGDTFPPLAELPTGLVPRDLQAERDMGERLAEALRLTAEWSMAVALPGWSWFDALQAYHEHRGWDRLPETGLPAGVTEQEAAEALWTTDYIHAVLTDPRTSDHLRDKALRHLARHAQLDQEVATVAVESPGPQPPTPKLGDEAGAVRGVPFLLEQLSELAQQSVYLWFSRMPGFMPWRVWTGPPAGTSGGQWGEGATAADALADAYRNVTSAIFDGRVVR
jgi:hypothetical protein